MQDVIVIEPVESEVATPVEFEQKQDGSHTFCVDYRKLNALIKPHSYPIPGIDECTYPLGEAFSILHFGRHLWLWGSRDRRRW